MGSSEGKSPLARLVVFMVCLAVAGTVVAGLHYYSVDLPAQDLVRAPVNAMQDPCNEEYARCIADCNDPGRAPDAIDTCEYACVLQQTICSRIRDS